VSPVRYEPSVYIPEDGILHSHRSENLKFENPRRDHVVNKVAVMQVFLQTLLFIFLGKLFHV
jgi:hypothetical protein